MSSETQGERTAGADRVKDAESPLDKGTAGTRADAGERPVGPQRPFSRVLVVDDVATNQMLVKLLLEKLGAEVEIAEDGAEAVALASEQRFDLILMDVLMPQMDGIEATRRLRAAGVETPVVALTATVTSDDRRRCLQAGCNDFIAKPLDRAKLLDVMRKNLGDSFCRD